MRQRPDFDVEESGGDLSEQAVGEIGPGYRQLIDVNREVGNVVAEGPKPNTPVEVKIGFAELEKAAKWFECLQAPLHALAAERVEHDIDPLPAGELAHSIAEREIARIEHIIGARQLQKRSLHLRSGRRGDDRAELFGVLDSRQTDTPGGSVNQDMLARRELCQV